MQTDYKPWTWNHENHENKVNSNYDFFIYSISIILSTTIIIDYFQLFHLSKFLSYY